MANTADTADTDAHQDASHHESKNAVPTRRVPGHPFQPGNQLHPKFKAQREEQERQEELQAILADLPQPSYLQVSLAEELAAVKVRARKMRLKGQPTDTLTDQILRLTRRLGLSPAPIAPPMAQDSQPNTTLRDRIIARRKA